MKETPWKPDKERKRDLAMIHMAKAKLGMDNDTYRAMLFAVAGVYSAAELGREGRRAVLAEMKKMGFKPKPGKRRYPGRPKNINNTDTGRQLKKVEALLTEAGRPWEYAHTLANQMFNVEKVQWLRSDQLRRLIAALVYDQTRRGGK